MDPNEGTAPGNQEQNIIDRIQTAVKDAISGSTQAIENSIVDKLSGTEIAKRGELAFKGWNKLQEMRKAFNQINRPDQKIFDAQGQPVQTYSEARFKQIEKDQKNLKEFSAIYEKALLNNTAEDYDKLDKQLKQGGGDSKQGGGNKPEGSTEG